MTPLYPCCFAPVGPDGHGPLCRTLGSVVIEVARA